MVAAADAVVGSSNAVGDVVDAVEFAVAAVPFVTEDATAIGLAAAAVSEGEEPAIAGGSLKDDCAVVAAIGMRVDDVVEDGEDAEDDAMVLLKACCQHQ